MSIKNKSKRRRIRKHLTILQNSDMCPLCEKLMSFKSIDHIIPKCLGGTDSLDNLILCCLKCNHKKSIQENKSSMKKESVQIKELQ